MHTAAASFSLGLLKFKYTPHNQKARLGAWQGVVLIVGVACTFDLNMVPEAISKKLEPMMLVTNLVQSSIRVGILLVITHAVEYTSQNVIGHRINQQALNQLLQD